eukprot:353605_1
MAMEIIPMEKMFFCSPTHCHIKSQHTHFSPYRIRIKNTQALTTMHNAPDPACTAHEEAMKPKTLKEYYRQEFGPKFKFSVYLVVALVAIIWNMVFWTVQMAMVLVSTVSDDEIDEYNLGRHVIWVGVLGIVLAILVVVGMLLYSQSVTFLLFGIYLTLNGFFTIFLALVTGNGICK